VHPHAARSAWYNHRKRAEHRAELSAKVARADAEYHKVVGGAAQGWGDLQLNRAPYKPLYASRGPPVKAAAAPPAAAAAHHMATEVLESDSEGGWTEEGSEEEGSELQAPRGRR